MLKNGTPASPATARGKERLAGAGRAHQQDALGDARAERRELLGVLEELDDFSELLLRFIDSRHVVEGDSHLAAGEEARAAFPEAHRLGVPSLAWRMMSTRKTPKSRNGRMLRRSPSHAGEPLLV